MPITPVQSGVQRDSEGYELDAQGVRIYPHWAAYIPAGAKTHGSKRPPWVPAIANYWDESQPPRGWYTLANGDWANAFDAEHVKEHPELLEMLQASIDKMKAEMVEVEGLPAHTNEIATQPPEPVKAEGGIKCPVCDKACASPAGLKVHMAHHRRSDQHHADASAEAKKTEA